MFSIRRETENEINEELYKCLEEIAVWKDARNDAIHEMAKILDVQFDSHYDSLEEYADDGYDIFRKLDKAIGKWRKNNETHK